MESVGRGGLSTVTTVSAVGLGIVLLSGPDGVRKDEDATLGSEGKLVEMEGGGSGESG